MIVSMLQRYLEGGDYEQRATFIHEAIRTIVMIGPSAISAIMALLSSYAIMVCG